MVLHQSWYPASLAPADLASVEQMIWLPNHAFHRHEVGGDARMDFTLLVQNQGSTETSSMGAECESC
jgi:hypothetical protein